MTRETVHRALKGRRTAVLAAQAAEVLGTVALTCVCAAGIGSIETAAGNYALPYQMLFTLFICLCDLMIVSPLKAFKHLILRRCITDKEIIYHNYCKKCLILRLRLWGKRVLYAAALGLLPARLCALSFEGAAQLLRDGTVMILAAGGILLTEVRMLRYGPAWQLLPDCATAGEAMKKSRRLMRGHTGDYLWLCWGEGGWGIGCLMVLPALYAAPMLGVSKALWVQSRSNQYE